MNRQRQAGRPALRSLEIHELLASAASFSQSIRAVKGRLTPGFEWYPYDTMSAVWHLDRLLRATIGGCFRDGAGCLVSGSQDGELAFFLESLGYEVIAADHPAYNHNGMRGIRALKTALGSGGRDPRNRCGPPVHAATRQLRSGDPARGSVSSAQSFLRVGRIGAALDAPAVEHAHRTPVPRWRADASAGGAGLSAEGERAFNEDDSELFLFFPNPRFRVLLERCHWEVRDFLRREIRPAATRSGLIAMKRGFLFCTDSV